MREVTKQEAEELAARNKLKYFDNLNSKLTIVLRVHALGQGGRAHQIAEHDCQLAAFGVARGG